MHNLVPGNVEGLPKQIDTKYFARLEGGDSFVRYGVSDDGSCLFHSIAAALNLSNFHHRTLKTQKKIGRNLRRIVQRTMNPESWKEFWDARGISSKDVPSVQSVIKKMKNPAQWSDVYMILYIMDMLNLNLVFFDAKTNSIYCGVRGKSNAKQTIFILWVNRAHFEPIFSIGKNKKVKTVFNKRDAIVSHIMNLYTLKSCSGVSLRSIL